MATNVYEYGRGGKCVCMFTYKYAGIIITNMQISKEDRNMGRVMRITRAPCQDMYWIRRKEEREQKGGYGYRTKNKPRSARNTSRKTGREVAPKLPRAIRVGQHPGGKKLGLNTGGLSGFFFNTGGLSALFSFLPWVYLWGLSKAGHLLFFLSYRGLIFEEKNRQTPGIDQRYLW